MIHPRGLLRHFLLCLELNFRSTQAMIYGYMVPVFFLVAFGSIFRAESPALLGQMGQILTITILGGACFGMPTAIVAERERGIWRRYRLLPVGTGSLMASVIAARVLIIASSAALQVALARVIYGTPLPLHPGAAAMAVILVAVSFLGLGLLIAAIADDVPAVQAVGQCIFLPMIMIGGVGIPLEALPVWAQRVSGFMPGRYAVEILQANYSGPDGVSGGSFGAVALCVIGAAAGVAGAKLMRWESGRRLSKSGWAWIAFALSGWLAVGAAAAQTGRLAVPPGPDRGYDAVTDSQIGGITFDQLPGDAEFVSRLAPPFDGRPLTGDLGAFADRLRSWPPGLQGDYGRRTRMLLSVAGIADVSIDLHEGEIARLVFDDLRSSLGDAVLSRTLTWVIMYPEDGSVVTTAPELGLPKKFSEKIIRERTVLYAKKFLGRLRGKIRN